MGLTPEPLVLIVVSKARYRQNKGELIMIINMKELRQMVSEELQKYRIEKNKKDKKRRNIDLPLLPKQENDTEKKDRLFSGYNDLRKLSIGIVENVFDEMLSEGDADGDTICMTRDRLRRYKDKIWKDFLRGVSAYERASKGEA